MRLLRSVEHGAGSFRPRSFAHHVQANPKEELGGMSATWPTAVESILEEGTVWNTPLVVTATFAYVHAS